MAGAGSGSGPDAPGPTCREHAAIAAAVPWVRHQAGDTNTFDVQVPWQATRTSKTAITQSMRGAPRSVGAIITRFRNDTAATFGPFANPPRISIDEISYQGGHKYLLVVVDHD